MISIRRFGVMIATAVVIGGANLFGGRGTAIGALCGAIAVGLMQNALNLMHVSAYYQYVWAGALTLVAAVALGVGTIVATSVAGPSAPK